MATVVDSPVFDRVGLNAALLIAAHGCVYARITCIDGGTSEIMKKIVGRRLGR
jgi:hypothetical protein